MTAPPSRSSISDTPSRATANAGFGQLFDWLFELLGGGSSTAAEKAAARASLQAARDLQTISASVASNALTLTLNPTALDFRSATLTSGAINTRSVASAVNLVVSNGSTLGTVSGQPARLAVLALDNAGTVELAVVNAAGGFSFDESRLISTTAEGGAGAADSASVVYSTIARSNLPFRVLGFIDITQAAAGVWASAPTRVQGAGGSQDASLLPPASMVRVQGANGFGSTNTVIRRFSSVLANVGSDITYTDSAADGASFTINVAGTYSFSYTDSFSAAAGMGVSQDSTELTTAIGSITAANRLAESITASANNRATCGNSVFLPAGAVIRPHTQGVGSGVIASTQFTITRVR